MSTKKTTYRGYGIYYDPKPIPSRKHDWDFQHEDFSGPGDLRTGTAESLEACKREIDEIEEESEDDDE